MKSFILLIFLSLISPLIFSSKTQRGKCKNKLSKEQCLSFETCYWNEKRERCFKNKKFKKNKKNSVEKNKPKSFKI